MLIKGFSDYGSTQLDAYLWKVKRIQKPDLSAIEGKINPFSVSLVIKIHSIAHRLQGGDLKEVDLEKQVFTKVFRSSELRKMKMRLKPSSLYLLTWIEDELPPAKDCIWINRKRFMDESGITSENTVIAAIKELRDKGFIQPTTIQQVYWINPAIFFCGSRIRKYRDKIVR